MFHPFVIIGGKKEKERRFLFHFFLEFDKYCSNAISILDLSTKRRRADSILSMTRPITDTSLPMSRKKQRFCNWRDVS